MAEEEKRSSWKMSKWSILRRRWMRGTRNFNLNEENEEVKRWDV